MGGRFGFDFAFDALAATRSGQEPGIYLLGGYFGTTGITGNATYTIKYYEIRTDLSRVPATGFDTQVEALIPGENAGISIIGIDATLLNITLYLEDAFTITEPAGSFSFKLIDIAIGITAELSGGLWSQGLPAPAKVSSKYTRDYIGAMGIEGDYNIDYSFTDPNGDVFTSSDNPRIMRYAPYVFITEVDGNTNVEDPQPITTKSSVTVKYIKGANVATDAQGQPIYDENGAIGWTGGQELSTAVSLTVGDNDITSQITNISDDFVNLENAMNQIDIEREEAEGFVRPWDSIATAAFNFEDSTAPIDTYIGDGETATPTIGADYGGTAVKGNKSIFRSHMSIGFDTPGVELSWSGKHICYPYSQKPSVGNTIYNWNGSANKGYFNLRGNWSFECGIENTGPQDATEHTNAGLPTQEQLLQAQSGPTQTYLQAPCSIYNDEIGFNTQLPTIYVNGVACTWPAAALEKITKYKTFVSYEYQSGLTKGVVTISMLSKTDGLLHVETTDIPAPPATSATEDIKLCGGYDGSAYTPSAYKGLSNFVYFDNYLFDLGALSNSYMLNYDFYYLSPLYLGDSWTKTHSLDVDVNGYTNKFLELAVSDGYSNTGVIIKYTPDYHYTSPAVTAIPSWSDDYGNLPGVGDLNDFAYMVDYWYLPTSVLLAYTGINFSFIFYTEKDGNPDWANVPWSNPIYYCQEHINHLESKGIKWITWNSAPAGALLDLDPTQTDQIGRVENLTDSWKDHFLSSSVFDNYVVSNDPANNGRILPAYALGDGAHVNEVCYPLMGAALYNGFKQALVPNFISTSVVSINSPLSLAKVNTQPIPVSWTNSLGATINDHELTGESEFATDVTISRGFNFNVDEITVSLKTGIPVPLLKSYYTDLNVEVDFLGVYEIPDTVTSPIKFGWTVTNGNISGEEVQTTFTQAMTVDEINVVSMPAFTDDWGNAIPTIDLDTNIAYGAVQTNYLIPVQIGNALSVGHQTGSALAKLSSSRVAFASGGNDFLQAYSWDGTDYAAIGNQLSLVGIGAINIAYLSDNRIAFIDTSIKTIRTYDFDGADFTLVGNATPVVGFNGGLCNLDANSVAMIDVGSGLRKWAFDGTDWAQVGNQLAIAGINNARVTSIGTDRVAIADGGNSNIKVYDFDGTDWAQVGNPFALTLFAPALATLNDTDFAYIDQTNDSLEPYRFDETDLTVVGVPLSLSVSTPSIAAFNNSDIVLYDVNSDALRTYRFTKE